MRRPRSVLVAIAAVTASAGLLVHDARAAPNLSTRMVDFYEIEARAAGDGAALVVVGDEVPEPLFITSSRQQLIVWWRARHKCDRLLVPRARFSKRRHLVLAVEPVDGMLPCREAATIMETRIKDPPVGVWQLRAEASGPRLEPLYFTVPSAPRPADFDSVQRRVPEVDALRRIGESVAWTYHAEAKSKPAIAAYRWLLSLDELHWRAPMYHARVFANIGVTRTKGSAVTSLDQMMAGLRRLDKELADPNTPVRTAKERELRDLRAWLEPSLRFFAMRWHFAALTRLRPARAAYAAYLELFPTSPHAAIMRYFYGALLLVEGDEALAVRELGRAAKALPPGEQKTLATACLVALSIEPRDDELLRPCRDIKPPLPPIDLLPDISDERFARPVRDSE